MYFDNLTIAGIVAVSLYALLPVLFGKEILRVEDDTAESGRPSAHGSDDIAVAPGIRGRSDCPEPCHES